ncbi:hypothetical protein ATANTOWER_016707 [Ataeniobius toweri]|uniref:ATP synthase F0 subunit 8 n=1 Tax=Ataeniobius toweri TaxID=208326 RepID=A0ABU7A1V1_9TELE|nr:hypothetical protein [Ataeniobius toweri]
MYTEKHSAFAADSEFTLFVCLCLAFVLFVTSWVFISLLVKRRPEQQPHSRNIFQPRKLKCWSQIFVVASAEVLLTVPVRGYHMLIFNTNVICAFNVVIQLFMQQSKLNLVGQVCIYF